MTFCVKYNDRVVFTGCQVQGDSPVDLPVDTITDDLLDIALDRASVSPVELVKQGWA